MQSKAPAVLLFSLAAVLAASSAVSCRKERRAVGIGGQPAKLLVSLRDLAATDTGKTDWIYELSGCVEPVNGDLGPDNVVTFSALGLKKGLTNCNVQVRTTQPIPNVNYQTGAAPNLLYLANNVLISQEASGQLRAVAALQRVYNGATPTDKSFTLNVPVVFPAGTGNVGATVTAALQCVPPVVNSGSFAAGPDSGGTFTFVVGLTASTTFTCKELVVGVDGVMPRFKGAFPASDGEFAGAPEKTVVAKALSLVPAQTATANPPVVPAPPIVGAPTGGTGSTTPSAVDVQGTQSECIGSDRYYDVATRACVCRGEKKTFNETTKACDAVP